MNHFNQDLKIIKALRPLVECYWVSSSRHWTQSSFYSNNFDFSAALDNKDHFILIEKFILLLVYLMHLLISFVPIFLSIPNFFIMLVHTLTPLLFDRVSQGSVLGYFRVLFYLLPLKVFLKVLWLTFLQWWHSNLY